MQKTSIVDEIVGKFGGLLDHRVLGLRGHCLQSVLAVFVADVHGGWGS